MVEEAIEEGPAIRKPRATSNDIAILLLMVPIEPWRNSTPFFGAAAFCTTKNGNFRTSSSLSSLTTWLRRPLRKDQLVGTFEMHNVGTVPTFQMHNVGTVPTYKTHNVGTVPTFETVSYTHLTLPTILLV